MNKIDKDIGNQTDADALDRRGTQGAEMAELRQLIAQMEASHEKFRSDLSRCLHDSLSQDVGVLEVTLWLLKQRLPTELKDLHQDAAAALEGVKKIAGSVRQMAARLRPGILDSEGLAAAIQWRAREFENQTGARCVFEAQRGGATLDSRVSMALFRSFEDVLEIVGQPKTGNFLSVCLKVGLESVEMDMVCNGGYPQPGAPEAGNPGLAVISERVRFLGGRMTLEPRDGGVRLNLSIPLQH